jgi:hypothetical protein
MGENREPRNIEAGLGELAAISRSKAIEQEAKVDSHCLALACVIFQA